MRKLCEGTVQLIKHYFFEKLGDCGEDTDRSIIAFVCRFTLFVNRGDITHFLFAGHGGGTFANIVIKQIG